MKDESYLEISIVPLLLDALLGAALMLESGPWGAALMHESAFVIYY